VTILSLADSLIDAYIVLSWMLMVWRPYGPRFTPVINTHYTCVHFIGQILAQNTLNCFANLSSYCFIGTLTGCPLSLLLVISIIHLLIGFLFLVMIPLPVIFARDSIYAKRAYAISQKRLKLGSCNFHHTVAPSL